MNETLTIMAWGAYAFVALAIIPHAWGWNDFDDKPEFDGGYIVMALAWPWVVVCAIAILTILAVLLFLSETVKRWWLSPSSTSYVERCLACARPFKDGDLYLYDVSGDYIHAACLGPERECYVNLETGDPIGPDEPIPEPMRWTRS